MLPSEPSLLLNTRVFGNGGLLFDENHDEVSVSVVWRCIIIYCPRSQAVLCYYYGSFGTRSASSVSWVLLQRCSDWRRLRKARSRQMSSLFCFILGQLTGRRHVPAVRAPIHSFCSDLCKVLHPSALRPHQANLSPEKWGDHYSSAEMEWYIVTWKR